MIILLRATTLDSSTYLKSADLSALESKAQNITSFSIISSQHDQLFGYETLFASRFVDISRQIDPVLIDLVRN